MPTPTPVDAEPEGRAPDEVPTLDRWAFNSWRRTRPGTNARQISDAVVELLVAREERQRERQADHAETFKAVVDAVVANLLRSQLEPSQRASIEDEERGWIRVPLSSRRLKSAKRSRYDASPMPLGSLMTRREKGGIERLGIIEAMEELELIFLDKAPRRKEAGRASAIKCREQLLELIGIHSPRLDELDLLTCIIAADGKRSEQELIELRAPMPAKPSWKYVKRPTRWRRVEYRDSKQTRSWRADLRRINEGLAAADIKFDPTAVGGTADDQLQAAEVGIPIHERSLRRIFNNERWDHGGRLYGGFWQGMKREWRSGLRIDGCEVVSLDFNAMYLQLLYAVEARKQAPLEGDLYEGIDPPDDWPEDPAAKLATRNSIKQNVNALLFSKTQDKPHRLVKGTKAALSAGITGAVLEDRIRAKHPDIAKWLRMPGVGFELMHHESEIMAKVLLRCLDQGLVVLPLHDGLLVGEQNLSRVRREMQEAFRSHTEGFEARIGA